MPKIGPVALFVVLYFVILIAVAELNASYIIRDAVVGPVIVALVYSLFLAPAAITAVGIIILVKTGTGHRLSLATAFAFCIGAVVELLFAAAQSSALSALVQRVDIMLLVGMNVFLVCMFVVAWLVVARRSRRPQTV